MKLYDPKLTGSIEIQNAIPGTSPLTSSWAINVVNGGGSLTVADEGTAQGTATFLNFIGSGVTAAVSSNTASITITGGSGTSDFPYTGSAIISGSLIVTGSVRSSFGFTGSLLGTASYAISASYAPPSFIDNFVTVGLPGSNTQYNSIKTAVSSITDASVDNTYTVRVYPGVYIEDTITVPSYVAIKGESSTSTIVSASNVNNKIFQLSDQTMLIDMQIQGSTGTGASAIYYSSSTTPQRNAIAYAENIRFGSNYTNATCEGINGANIILQCSNVKYGGYTDATSQKSFDIGFLVTGSNSGIGRMQLRNVTSTNGGVAGSSQDQIFALADGPSCAFIVNGCLLTRAVGSAVGTGFKVYNGGSLRLTAVNFQRWTRGIWAPQTGSGPSIDAIALNFENCTTDVAIEHSGSTGKVQGTDTFLKTQISLSSSLYEVGQDPRRITVAKKGGDFTSISASVAYITDSAESNRYVIEVGPGEFVEKQIDMSNKPYVALLGSDIQTTVIVPSGSGTFDQLILGPTNEVSFLSLKGNNVAGYSAITTQNLGSDFSQAHKVSIYDYDYGIKVLANSGDTTFYGEYVDINGAFSYGTYVSSSNGYSAAASVENYYLFPSASTGVGNYATGPSSSISLYTCLFQGDSTAGSTAIKIERGATLEGIGLDVPNWDYGVQVPNTSPAPDFRIVGSMFHESVTYDFEVLNASTTGRFQGVSDHSKISNASQDFYWNFLDDTDGENDITRNLAVTFADGTHTDASTLIFNGSPMGPFTGGELTTGSGFVLNVNSGSGYLESSTNDEIYKRLDWSAGTVTLPASSNSYIYVTETNTLTYNGTQPSSINNLILGRVVTNTASIEFIDASPYDAAHMSNKLSAFNRAALGPVYSEGSTVTENITPYAIDVTSGKYFFSENQFTPIGGTGITMRQYFISASTFNISSTTLVPKDKYASGSALVSMSANYYTKHTLYLVGDGVDEKYMLVINGNQYATLVEAESANLPTIPTYFSDGVVALAAIYTNSGSANITQIQDIRPTIAFRAAGVNASAVHGNLLGLDADDHTQYVLVDGTRAMNGDLSLGGNDITNVATINATSFTGSLLGTASLAQNANTASYVLNAVSASFVTGSIFIGSNQATSASYAITSSFVTGSIFTGANRVVSASYAITSSFVTGSIFVGSNSAASSSFAITSSYVTGSVFVGSNRATSASYAITASYALNSVGGGVDVQDEGGTPFSITTLNFVGAGVTATDAGGGTATISIPGGAGDPFPYVGDAVITGSLTISGSHIKELNIIGDSYFTGSLFVASKIVASQITGSVQAVDSVSARSVGGASVHGLQSAINALSSRISAIPGGGSSNPTAFVSVAETRNTAALTGISGLTVSVSAGVIYDINCIIMYSVSAATGNAFGMVWPTANRVAGQWQGGTSVNQTGTSTFSTQAFGDFDTGDSNSAVWSAIVGATGLHIIRLNAVIDAQTGGAMYPVARTSAAGNTQVIARGSYFKISRIN